MKQVRKFKWMIKDVFNVFIATFVIEFALFIFLQLIDIGGLISIVNGIPVLSGLIFFLIYLLQVAGMLFPLWYFVIRKYASTYEDFSFEWIGSIKTLLWVLVSYIFYIGLSIFIIMLFSTLGIGLFGFEPTKSLFEIFGKDIAGFTFAFLIAVVIAPFVEELFFRGFVLQTLAKKISPFWGVVLTALIFASVHFEFQSIMPLLILSVVLNVLYIKTKSIWPGIVFHIMNNSIAFIILILIEGGVLI
jgi:membrane protease YdiL (CAAX protease family)